MTTQAEREDYRSDFESSVLHADEFVESIRCKRLGETGLLLLADIDRLEAEVEALRVERDEANNALDVLISTNEMACVRQRDAALEVLRLLVRENVPEAAPKDRIDALLSPQERAG